MAQSKLSGFAAKFAKGGPPTAGLGLLGALGALAYGVTQSVYTGISEFLSFGFMYFCFLYSNIPIEHNLIGGFQTFKVIITCFCLFVLEKDVECF